MARRNQTQIQGDLQLAIMRVLWRLEEGSVEEVSSALPRSHRGAYTTIQTVLNRLAERGLLERSRRSKAIRYTPTVSEADYFSRSLQMTLSQASPEARQLALNRLIGEIDHEDLDQIDAIAREIEEVRGRRSR